MATTHTPGHRPGTTRADSATAPGDAPADTTDPREQVSTVVVSGVQAADAARAGLPAAGYVKTGDVPEPRTDPAPGPAGFDLYGDDTADRVEEYVVGGVTIRRNIDTGVSVRAPGGQR